MAKLKKEAKASHQPTIMFHIRLDIKQHRQVLATSRKLGLTAAEFVRRAVALAVFEAL